ncbi:MAG: hypothetical protein Q9163_005215 [Psora crenata]
MIKPLAFKGDKKARKRKAPSGSGGGERGLTVQNAATETKDDDSWVTVEAASDLVGPVILVLASRTQTCIACDANGEVFASELENMVEKNPTTAEPHDVRQVWIANKVVGTEGISFKGHNGRWATLTIRLLGLLNGIRYLSCDRIGILSANREAISAEESFLCILSPETPGAFTIHSVHQKLLAIVEGAKGPEIRGDAESISPNNMVCIRMQARFKPKYKTTLEEKATHRISRKELEETVGRPLKDNEVRRLKKARVQGEFHEALLDLRVKGRHDKYS